MFEVKPCADNDDRGRSSATISSRRFSEQSPVVRAGKSERYQKLAKVKLLLYRRHAQKPIPDENNGDLNIWAV